MEAQRDRVTHGAIFEHSPELFLFCCAVPLRSFGQRWWQDWLGGNQLREDGPAERWPECDSSYGTEREGQEAAGPCGCLGDWGSSQEV